MNDKLGAALNKIVEDGERALKELTARAEHDAVMGFLKEAKADPVYQGVERLRKNHYHLWKVLHELYLSPYAEPSLLEEWRGAPEGSQEWRKARQHDEAIDLLLIAVRRR